MATSTSSAQPIPSGRPHLLVRRTWDDYRVRRVLGEGATCIVFELVPRPHSNPSYIKLVAKVAKGKVDHDDYIRHEWDIGSWLSKNVARSQLPTIFYAAKTTFNNGRPCILMEKGETNVFQFLHSGERAAGQPNLISRIGDIAPRLICLLEKFHDFGYVHRDVKLQNFLVVLDQSQLQYGFKIGDLGLSVRYLDEDGNHIPSGSSPYAGTPLFSSKNTDRGSVQSRRDDMESLAHSLIHAALQSPLPWEGKPFKELQMIKAETSPLTLCDGLPAVFTNFLIYCSQIGFEERPGYCKWEAEFAALGAPDSRTLVWEGSRDTFHSPSSSHHGTETPEDFPGCESGGVAPLAVEGALVPNKSLQSGMGSWCTDAQEQPSHPWPRQDDHNSNTCASQSKAQKARLRRLMGPQSGTKSPLSPVTNAVPSEPRNQMTNVPNFARPTIAFLARQKPPVRARQLPRAKSTVIH